MSTVDKTGSISLPAAGFGKCVIMQNHIDFTVSANQLTQGQTMDIFDLPANVLCQEVLMHISTVCAGVTDVDIGTAADTSGFMDGATLATSGWVRDVSGEAYTLASGGYISNSDAVITLKNMDATTLTSAIIDFYAVCFDLRDQR